MATYPLPQIPVAPQSEWLRIVNKQSNQASQYSGRQTVIQLYASWTLQLNYPRMAIGQGQVLAAYIDQLQGSFGSFQYTPTSGIYPSLAPLALAGIAYPTTTTVAVSGFAANTATGLRVGQYIQIGSQLLRLCAAPLTADGSGQATIEFNPPLRSQYPAGTSVECSAPAGVFRLDQSNGSGFQLDPDRIPEFDTINAIEVI